MSKHRVFIYGSCVSRDTFEHFDPEQFELVQYVARQSALSAYTRPVTLVEPPQLESSFQQRMVSGDYASNLQALIAESAARTDLVIVDLIDERLGAYVLPDGSVVTRSTELISSGAEHHLPAGSQHLPFGSEQHFQYWSQGITAVGGFVQHHMPHAAVVLLSVPWAERSEAGVPTPASFGITAAEANPVFDTYVQVAAQALHAEVVSLRRDDVISSPDHPWGDAPFHYAQDVYLRLAKAITGTPGRAAWGSRSEAQSSTKPSRQLETVARTTTSAQRSSHSNPSSTAAPNFIIAGTQRGGAEWLRKQLGKLPEVFAAPDAASNFYNRPDRLADARARDEHREIFEGRDEIWRMECSPNYFWYASDSPFSKKSASAATAIREFGDPDTQVLLSLRNPVERAISAFWVHFSVGKFDLPTSVFHTPPGLGVVDIGFYRKHYQHWANELGSERIHVVLHEDANNAPALLRTIAGTILQTSMPPDLLATGDFTLPDEHAAWLNPFKKRAPVSAQEIAALHSLYRDDISFIEDLLGRELPEWSDLDILLDRLAK